MGKILNSTIKSFIITILLMIANGLTAQYSGGTGTEDNPYQISDLDNLCTLSLTADDWSKHFILTADIDASDTENWNDGKGFSPIGEYGAYFSGSFDGQGHTISGLYIARNNSNDIGLFGFTVGALIKDLILDNFNIDGLFRVGGLAGSVGAFGPPEITEISNINIINCNIAGGSNIGGLAGIIHSGIVNNCQVSGVLSGSISIIGGLVGQTSSGYGTVIKNCSVTVDITGPKYVGGLIGINKETVSHCQVFVNAVNASTYYGCFGGLTATNIGVIDNCYTSGEILIEGSISYIGGIVGHNSGFIINCYSNVSLISANSYCVGGLTGKNEKVVKKCYSFGEILGKNYVGGLSGITAHGSQTINCYATGVITGEDKTGGLVGENGYFATITNCYAAGEVRCEAWFSGGFVGLNRSTAVTVDCFFDIESSGKVHGIGMDHNGQNQQPVDLTTIEFNHQNTFLDAGWDFGNTNQSPWKMGTAPDGRKRPVLFYHNYIVLFEVTEGGILEPDSMQSQTVNCGSNTSAIQAIPNEEYLFVKWQSLMGDSITNANPIVVENVISDSTLVAVFAYIGGIDETKVKHVKVYPNPAKKELYISFSNSTNIEEIKIYNQLGQMVKHENRFINYIDVSFLHQGIYIIEIVTKESRFTEKLIIN